MEKNLKILNYLFGKTNCLYVNCLYELILIYYKRKNSKKVQELGILLMSIINRNEFFNSIDQEYYKFKMENLCIIFKNL
jgi:hypothetical protein